MTLDEFDFDLPEDLIALRPVYPRDEARLLIVHANGRLDDRRVLDLPDYLTSGDALVVNDTRVIRAALKAVRVARNESSQDVPVDLNLIERLSASCWRALARPGKRLRPGDRLTFPGSTLDATLIEKQAGGEIDVEFSVSGSALDAAVEATGQMPLPPYIARKRATDDQDVTDYQTRFADAAGSVAAPTAGLHFTDRLLTSLHEKDVIQTSVTLHVGAGTFATLKDDDVSSGTLHAEWRSISDDTAKRLNATKQNNHRVVAVGTTSLRTLESSATTEGVLESGAGDTNIFIKPGYRFRFVDGLMTNFHLPKSSLFMLVSAMMGTDVMQAAYAHAIKNEYRFYSYGDACLLLPDHD